MTVAGVHEVCPDDVGSQITSPRLDQAKILPVYMLSLSVTGWTAELP